MTPKYLLTTRIKKIMQPDEFDAFLKRYRGADGRTWKPTERDAHLMMDYLHGIKTMRQLADTWGVARSTAYKRLRAIEQYVKQKYETDEVSAPDSVNGAESPTGDSHSDR